MVQQAAATMVYPCREPALAGCITVTLQTVLNELIASKTAGNRRKVYCNSLRYYVNRFVQTIGPSSPVTSLTTAQVETFLNQFSGYARQTWLNRISTFFAYAVRREYIERNPCKPIDRVRIDRKPPVVLTVDQAKNLLLSCPNICKPYLILGMFAGVRPDELHRMNWTEINLETGTVKVDGKTRQRRIVYLEPVAIQYLSAHPLKSGPVCPSKETVRRWKRKARLQLGGKWTADILRHTAASYLLAKYQDVGKVAMALGNSPQILLRHYHDPVTKEESKKFWEDCLPMSANVGLATGGSTVEARFDGKTNGKGNNPTDSGDERANGGPCPKRATKLELDGGQSVQNAA